MKWTAVPSATPPYVTIAEDTHYGVWQRDPERGFFDEKLFAKILPHVPEGCIAIDGGAFNGEYSIAIARKARQVFSFEPQTVPRMCLITNVFLGGHPNITSLPHALGERPGGAWANEMDGPGNLGGRVLFDKLPSDYSIVPLVSVGVVMIDELHLPVGFIKLDLEGWEGNALRGAETTIERHRPVLWIEMNDPLLALQGDSTTGVMLWLQARGYEITAGTGEMGTPQWDALCLPR